VSNETTTNKTNGAAAEQTSTGMQAISIFVRIPTIAINAPAMSAGNAPDLVAPFHRTAPITGRPPGCVHGKEINQCINNHRYRQNNDKSYDA
jgi:hypothetical protein